MSRRYFFCEGDFFKWYRAYLESKDYSGRIGLATTPKEGKRKWDFIRNPFESWKNIRYLSVP